MRWGIISTGKIAHAFAHALRYVPHAQLVAVASRDAANAASFAHEFSIPQHYSSYHELVLDPDVDIVYIATPHHLHYQNSLMCLRAGKHVLCEKPICITPQQTEHLGYLAKKRGLFIMEALWTHFLPAYAKVQEWLSGGRIGKIKAFDFTFGFKAEYKPQSRLFNPELAGGALYDIGIYPIAVAMHLQNKRPDVISAIGTLSREGVDINSSVSMLFDDCVMNAHFTFEVPLRNEGVIYGTDGHIVLHPRFWETKSVSLYSKEGEELYQADFDGPGYRYEAEHVQWCIHQGYSESPIHPMRDAMSLNLALEAVRNQLKIRFPDSIKSVEMPS